MPKWHFNKIKLINNCTVYRVHMHTGTKALLRWSDRSSDISVPLVVTEIMCVGGGGITFQNKRPRK